MHFLKCITTGARFGGLSTAFRKGRCTLANKIKPSANQIEGRLFYLCHSAYQQPRFWLILWRYWFSARSQHSIIYWWLLLHKGRQCGHSKWDLYVSQSLWVEIQSTRSKPKSYSSNWVHRGLSRLQRNFDSRKRQIYSGRFWGRWFHCGFWDLARWKRPQLGLC